MSEQDSAPGNRSLFFKDKYSANTKSELICLLLTFSSVAFPIQPWFSLQFTGFSCRWWHLLPLRQTISTVTIEGFATDLTVTMDTTATTLATWHQVSDEIILKHVYPASLLTEQLKRLTRRLLSWCLTLHRLFVSHQRGRLAFINKDYSLKTWVIRHKQSKQINWQIVLIFLSFICGGSCAGMYFISINATNADNPSDLLALETHSIQFINKSSLWKWPRPLFQQDGAAWRSED